MRLDVDVSRRQTCGRRFDGYLYSEWPTTAPNEDGWRKWSGFAGSDTIGKGLWCNYCGSLHPDTLMEKLRAGWILGGTDKRYKWYVEAPAAGSDDPDTPGVPRGRMVGKFYTVHLPRVHANELLDMFDAGTLRHSWYVHPWIPSLSDEAPDWLRNGQL